MQNLKEQSVTVRSVYSSDAVDTSPRILIVGPHRTRTLGGISTVIDGLLRAAPKAGYEVRHIASQNDEYQGSGKLVLAIAALLQYVLKVVWWRPNLTMIHVGSNASLYRKAVFITAADWLGQRVVTHFHAGDFDHYYEQQSNLGRCFIQSGLRRSHKLIAVSQATAQRLRQLLPDADIVMIPNGIKTQEFAPIVRERDGYVRVLFVGGMSKLKGEGDLIRALALAAKRAPQLRISLLGHGAEGVAALCDECGIRSHIEYLGPVPHAERAQFFRNADIFALPSYGEGMPMAVLEAMAAGLPVIATHVGGIPELITHGAEGFLIRPGDVQDLAERIVRLANDQNLRSQMGQLALKKVQQFEEQHVMERLLKELRTDE